MLIEEFSPFGGFFCLITCDVIKIALPSHDVVKPFVMLLEYLQLKRVFLRD